MDSGARLLHHARHLIERGWTQDADARAADNSRVQPWDKRATRWSLLGALVAAVERIATTVNEYTAVRELARGCILLADTLDTDSLEQWNDSPARTREDVLSALDHAAALAQNRKNGQRPLSSS